MFTHWGLNWQWGQWNNVGYDKCAQIIDAGQPFPFLRYGCLEEVFADRIPPARGQLAKRGPGKVGHVVVCYGYEDGEIRICLGWAPDTMTKTSTWPSTPTTVSSSSPSSGFLPWRQLPI